MNAFRRACYGLGLFGLLLVVAHLIWPDYEWGQGRSSYFNLGNSLTLASWLVTMQLVVAAVLCLVGFHRERWGRLPGRSANWVWVVAAIVFLLLSFAEMTRMHDRLALLGWPSPRLYDRLVTTPLAVCMLALFALFLFRRLSAEDRPWAWAWLASWGYAVLLGFVERAIPDRLELVVDLGIGAGFLLGTTLLLLALAGAVLRPAEATAPATEPAAAWPEGRARTWILIGVGGTTFTIIFLQIILFQMLTIFADYITANTILSIALLGISVGGLIGFFTASRAPLETMIAAALLLPITVLVAFGAAVSRVDTPLFASLLMTLPFICASTVITVALARADSHIVYAIDLLGAAIGAFMVNQALSSFREESSLLLLAAFNVLVAACFVIAHPAMRMRVRLAPVLVLGFLGFLAVGTMNLDHDWLNVVRTKMQQRYPELEMVFSRSSFVGRYDIVRTAPENSTLKSVENGRIIDTIRSRTYEYYQIDPRLPNYMYDNPRILIIGLSGDAITKTAHYMSDDVVGIEINPKVAELQGNELRPYNGNSYDGIDVVAMDGRTYAEQSEEPFDIVTLLNTHFAKGFVTDRAASPEYLQTVEAMRTYLRTMTERGMVVIEEPISRPYREIPVWKLLATMRQALIEEGNATPEQHFFVFQWKSRRNNYFQVLMKKTPFTAEDLSALRLWLHECDTLAAIERAAGERRGPIKAINTILFAPDEPFDTTIARVVEGRASDDLVRAYNLHPTTDDRPFPFDVDPSRRETKRAYNRVLLLLLLLVPFFGYFLVQHRADLRRALPYVSIVGLTGMGYLMIEVVLIQRYAIFLGSPVATFAAVLGSLLIFSGVGSLWSGRIGPRGLYLGLGGLFAMLLVQLVAMPAIFGLFGGLGFGMRAVVAVLSLAPLAFFMGLPFPYVMRTGKQHFSESSAAMLFAINAATSALAVPLALNVASAWGLNQVLLVSMLVYAAVTLSLVGYHRPALLTSANWSAYALLAILLVSPWLLSRPAQADPVQDARWELFGLSVGDSHYREDRTFLGGSRNNRVAFEWLFWMARNGDRIVLVDTAFDDEKLARQWGIDDYVRPTEKLALLGVAPEDVTDVIVTHGHWDHAGDVAPYTNAKIYIQEAEYRHMQGSLNDERPIARGMRLEHLRVLEQAETEGRLVLLDGDREIAPGLSAVLGGAHTKGFQHVIVETLDGAVVIAGDATYQYWNSRRHVPIGSSVDPEQNLAAIREMHRKAASPFLILPGHDRRVIRWFPEVAHEVVRISMEAQ